MLNKDLFVDKLEELKVFYPNWSLDITKKSNVLAWYKQFEDLTDNEFKRMIDTHVKSEQYPPTVGSLRRYIVKEFDSTKDNPTLQQIKEWEREAEKVSESTKQEFRRKMKELIEGKTDVQ